MKLEVFDYNHLNFVELNTSGDNENYSKCHHTSKYIHSEVFNLFTQCFERSNNLYEYYGPTRYNSRQIVPLRNELKKNLDVMESIGSRDQFIEFMSEIFLGKEFIMELQKTDRTWDLNWMQYLTKLKEINKTMLGIADECIAKELVLWVIGY
ncbi:MAG: hypothetical protein U0T82_18020 [Bacteroidales bacterium]